jgi:hypothetical protein
MMASPASLRILVVDGNRRSIAASRDRRVIEAIVPGGETPGVGRVV